MGAIFLADLAGKQRSNSFHLAREKQPRAVCARWI